MKLFAIALSMTLMISPTFAAEVKTIAGTGQKGFVAGVQIALETPVGEPYGLAKNADGELFICEIATHVVRKLDERTGKLTLVAGNGSRGYSGDGGLATAAQMNEPYEVRFDRAGNIFIVEMKNHLVRRVDRTTGLISTVAGSGQSGFSGDGGAATQAKLSSPHSIALDDRGQLYICDIGNNRVRVVDLASGVIQTIAGTGEKKPTPDGAALQGTPLNGPRALDFDGQRGLLLALREGNAVYRIDLERQTLHHIGGTGKSGYTGDGGPAKQATLSGPKGIALGPHGDVYFADTESHTIRVIRKASGVIETVVGNGQKGDGPDGDPKACRMARPHGVFVDSAGNVYIGDSEAHRVRRLPAK